MMLESTRMEKNRLPTVFICCHCCISESVNSDGTYDVLRTRKTYGKNPRIKHRCQTVYKTITFKKDWTWNQCNNAWFETMEERLAQKNNNIVKDSANSIKLQINQHENCPTCGLCFTLLQFQKWDELQQSMIQHIKQAHARRNNPAYNPIKLKNNEIVINGNRNSQDVNPCTNRNSISSLNLNDVALRNQNNHNHNAMNIVDTADVDDNNNSNKIIQSVSILGQSCPPNNNINCQYNCFSNNCNIVNNDNINTNNSNMIAVYTQVGNLGIILPLTNSFAFQTLPNNNDNLRANTNTDIRVNRPTYTHSNTTNCNYGRCIEEQNIRNINNTFQEPPFKKFRCNENELFSMLWNILKNPNTGNNNNNTSNKL